VDGELINSAQARDKECGAGAVRQLIGDIPLILAYPNSSEPVG
jgi:hypothetical protein